MPYVLEFNKPSCEVPLARIATAMGDKAQAQAAINAVHRLREEVDIPPNLSAIGLTEQYISQMAQDAFESGNAQVVNPRKPSYQEIVDLYKQAL